MEHNICNPFVPRASIIRYPNGVFELRLHLHGIASHVDIVPVDNYIIVSGHLVPRAKKDCSGYISTIVWTDAVCGYFSRDIQLRLSPGTRILILERRQDCDDYVIRYTLRSGYIPRRTCASYAQIDQYSARSHCSCGYYRNDICSGNNLNRTPCVKGADCTCGPNHVGGFLGQSTAHLHNPHTGVFTHDGATVTVTPQSTVAANPVVVNTPAAAAEAQTENLEGFAITQEI